MGISFLAGLRKYFSGSNKAGIELAAGECLSLTSRKQTILCRNQSYLLDLSGQQLGIYLDSTLTDAEDERPDDYLLFDPERRHNGIAHFLRLEPQQSLTLEAGSSESALLCGRPVAAAFRTLTIDHEGDALSFSVQADPGSVRLSLLNDPAELDFPQQRRRQALQRVLDLYGGPIEQLSPIVALAQIEEVNSLVFNDPYRSADIHGRPGGLLEPPAHITPILLGDLHAQVDNLLKVLSENAFLEQLESGRAMLIFLGDAVHSEDPLALEQMDDSVVIMDLILTLKQHFPQRVFFLIGNHDNFEPGITKAGIPQNLLWRQRLLELRGEEYLLAMQRFYDLAPLMVHSKDFLACHAGPPRGRVDREMLINAREYPDLTRELIWNRLQRPGYISGYNGMDVERLRQGLEQEPDIPLIVGHSPQSQDATIWLDIAGIKQHHILFSAQPDQVGVFTRIDGVMVPQVYKAEPLREWANRELAPH